MVIDYESRDAMKALRGPLSNRATSAEFNEWSAREVCEYIDTLQALVSEAREMVADAARIIPAIPILQPQSGYPHIPEVVEYCKLLLEIEPKTTGFVNRARSFLNRTGK